MPAFFKLIISLLVVLVAAGFLWAGNLQPGSNLNWIVPSLVLFMILAIWLFPEAKKLPAQKK